MTVQTIDPPIPERDLLWSPAQRARLVRLCTAVVGDASAAEDLAQETLLTAWRLQHRLTDPPGADAWLNAIARNVCRRWLRTRGSTPVPTAELETGEARDLDSVLEREEVVELLDRALAMLPAATREALVGHYVEELSHAEIATRLGTSADAVSMRVSRGRSRLRYLLETRFADDAVAEGWSRRDDAGWRPTRLRCPDCGRAAYRSGTTRPRSPSAAGPATPTALSARLPLDAPAFAALLGDVRRPSAIQSRVAAWTDSYWVSPSPSVCALRPTGVTAAVHPRGRRALVGPSRLVRRVRRLRRGGQRLGGRDHARPAGGTRGAQARTAAAAAARARRRP